MVGVVAGKDIVIGPLCRKIRFRAIQVVQERKAWDYWTYRQGSNQTDQACQSTRFQEPALPVIARAIPSMAHQAVGHDRSG